MENIYSNIESPFNNDKLNLLQKANNILNISKSKINKIIFVYSKPKVGSTSLVTSLRIFASNKYNIIHIHDEEMLKVLVNINNITINELILYNKYIGKEVFVIDIYRSPIERKISAFFEKIDTHHFNADYEKINQYDINRLFNRFNKIFPYIAQGDHFIDTYNIPIPDTFDFKKKYLIVEYSGIKYIKLRLKDSLEWDGILSNIFSEKIKIVTDYETLNKPIKESYLSFKNKYKIPINLLDNLNNCKYLNYFYSLEEKKEYFNEWFNKSELVFIPFTYEEYNLYEYISIENNFGYNIQSKHYIDQGCMCKACDIKRRKIGNRILQGENIRENIIHEEARNEFITNRINQICKLPLKPRQSLKNTPKMNINKIIELK